METDKSQMVSLKMSQLGDEIINGGNNMLYSKGGNNAIGYSNKSSMFQIDVSSSGRYNNDIDDDDDDDDDDDEGDGSQLKRRKYTDDERLVRCRERNRKHARNTRERKKLQMDTLQMKIQQLTDEKLRLKNYANEESVASILISLTGRSPSHSISADSIAAGELGIKSESSNNFSYCSDDFIPYSAREEASKTMETIRNNVAAMLSDDEELEIPQPLLSSTDKAACSVADMEMIRRERNRMHAKKTRLRKKKMLQEMENIVSRMQEEIRGMKKALISDGNAGMLRESGSGNVSVESARDMEDNYMEYKQELQITSPFGPYGNTLVPVKIPRSALPNAAQMNGYPVREASVSPDSIIHGLLSLSDRTMETSEDCGVDKDIGGNTSSHHGSDDVKIDVLYGSSLSQAGSKVNIILS